MVKTTNFKKTKQIVAFFVMAIAVIIVGIFIGRPANAKPKGPKVSVNCKTKEKNKNGSIRYQGTSYTIMVNPKSGRRTLIRYKVFDNLTGKRKSPGKKFRKLYDCDSSLDRGDVGFCLRARKGTGNTKQKNKYRHYETASVYYYKQSVFTNKWVCASKPTKITLKYNSKGKLKYSVKR